MTERAPRPSVPVGRILELDGIRGCAILLVLFYHYGACQLEPEPGTWLHYARAVMGLGWSGVDLFFVLSGFLIGRILLQHRGAENYFKVFYLRRVCRIFPLYYSVIGSFMLARAVGLDQHEDLRWLFHDPMPLWSYLTYTQNFLMAHAGELGAHWLGITWSLAIEEQFYLALPLIIWFTPNRKLPLFLLACVALAMLLRATAFGTLGGFVLMPWRADSLLLGTLVAYAIRNQAVVTFLAEHRNYLYLLLGLFLVGAAHMAAVGTSYAHPGFGRLHYTWLAGMYAVLVLIALVDTGGRLATFFRWSALRWLGAVSYGVYMVHQTVSGLLHGLLRGSYPRIASGDDALVTLLALVVTLGVAAALYYGMERPIQALGHRYKYRFPPGRGVAS